MEAAQMMAMKVVLAREQQLERAASDRREGRPGKLKTRSRNERDNRNRKAWKSAHSTQAETTLRCNRVTPECSSLWH